MSGVIWQAALNLTFTFGREMLPDSPLLQHLWLLSHFRVRFFLDTHTHIYIVLFICWVCSFLGSPLVVVLLTVVVSLVSLSTGSRVRGLQQWWE